MKWRSPLTLEKAVSDKNCDENILENIEGVSRRGKRDKYRQLFCEVRIGSGSGGESILRC